MAEFVTCSQDCVVFWDYKSFSSKRSAQPFSGSGYHVQSACWSASNSKLMVAPKWGDCIVWCELANDSSNWNAIWHKDSGHFTSGCLMSNSRYILSGSSDGLLKLWDIRNKSSSKTLEGHNVPVTGVASSSSDQLVLSGGQDGRLLLHSLSSSHALQSTVTLSHTDVMSQGAITRVRFSVMDRAVAASASENGCVCLWSVESQRLLHTFPSSSQSGPTTDLYFAQSNNKLLVSVGQDCKIHFLDIQQRKEVMLVGTPSPLSSVAILRDGYTVAVGGVDGKLYVYELRAMKSPKHVFDAHQGAVTCIAEQNSAKSSRGSLKRGSLHSSRKSVKESSRTSVPSPSDSLTPSSTPGVAQDIQHAPTSSRTQGSIISPLVPPNDSPMDPSQPPPLPIVFQAPTSSRSALYMPHQTPFAAPHNTVQWAQFTTPAQPASDKDSTGIFSPVDSTMSMPHPLTTTDDGHPLTITDGGHPLTTTDGSPPLTTTEGSHPLTAAGDGGSGSSKTAVVGPPLTQRPLLGGLAVQDSRGYPLMSTFVSSTPAMKQPPLGMSGIFSPLDATTPALLGAAGPAARGRWHAKQDVPSATPSVATPTLSTVNEVRSPANIVGGKSDVDVAGTTSPHTLPISTTATATSGSQTSLSSQSSKESSTSCQQQQPQPFGQHGRHHVTTAGSSVGGSDTLPPIPTAELSSQSTHHQPHAIHFVQSLSHPLPTVTSDTVIPEASSIHLQYLEKLIRDSNEELRHATHRDIRALGLDMFRQFLLLQQQVGTAVSALHEKIERLSAENKHLQEQLHQYAPKY